VRLLKLFAVSASLFGFVFSIALLWLPHAWPFVVLNFSLATSLLLLSIVAIGEKTPLDWHPLLLLPFAVAVLALGQLFAEATIDPWETRRAAFEWAGFGLASALGFQLLGQPLHRLRFLQGFVCLAVALSLFAIAHNYAAPGKVFFVFDTGFRDQVFGPFVYHTKFANFIELALAPALWLAMTSARNRLVYWGASAILLACVAASSSRGGTLIVTLELSLLLFLHFRSTHSSHRPDLYRFFFLFIPTFAIAWLLLGADSITDRLKSSDALLDTRWAILASSLDMAKLYFWTGSGLGTWPILYPEFARFDNGLRINQAHCDWIQWLIEGGLTMLAISITIFSIAVRIACVHWWAFGFVFVWIHGAIDYPMQQTPALSALYFAFWGIALRASRPNASLDRSYSQFR